MKTNGRIPGNFSGRNQGSRSSTSLNTVRGHNDVEHILGCTETRLIPSVRRLLWGRPDRPRRSGTGRPRRRPPAATTRACTVTTAGSARTPTPGSASSPTPTSPP